MAFEAILTLERDQKKANETDLPAVMEDKAIAVNHTGIVVSEAALELSMACLVVAVEECLFEPSPAVGSSLGEAVKHVFVSVVTFGAPALVVKRPFWP